MQTCIHFRLHPSFALLASLAIFLSSTVVLADDTTDRQSIESAAQRWTQAFNTRDPATLESLATEDILVLAGSSLPTASRVNAPNLWLRASALARGSLKSVSKEVVISNDTAWRVASLTYQTSGNDLHTGESLEIWMRTRDGWKLHRQMSSLIFDLPPRRSPSGPVLDRPTN